MAQGLNSLKLLQQLDLEIDEILALQESLPKKIESLKANLQLERDTLSKKKENFTKLQQKHRSLEGDLKDKENRNQRAGEKLMSIQSSEELRAMEKEIDMAKREISLLEEEILETLLQMDTEKKKL